MLSVPYDGAVVPASMVETELDEARQKRPAFILKVGRMGHL